MKTNIAALAGASLLVAAAPAGAQSQHDSWSHGSHGGANGGGWMRGGPSGGGSPGFPSGGPRASSAGIASGGGPRVGSPGGGFLHGGFGGSRHFDGDHDHHHHHFHGFPVFLGGFGFGLGLAAFDPWFFDGPYYGYWEPYPDYAYGYPPYGPPPPYYTPPARSEAAPPAAAQPQPPPAACGSWVWDSVKQVYNWSPCAAE